MTEKPPLIFKYLTKKLGGHWHVRVFSGREGYTFARLGELVMDDDDYEELKRISIPEGHIFEYDS